VDVQWYGIQASDTGGGGLEVDFSAKEDGIVLVGEVEFAMDVVVALNLGNFECGCRYGVFEIETYFRDGCDRDDHSFWD